MLGARHRFHGRGGPRGVYERGQSLRAGFITLKFVRREPRRPYRAAVVVSRKVSKSAVVRNRIRRRVYEITRQAGIGPGLDLVFTVFDEKVATVPDAELRSTITGLIQKATTKT